MLDLLLTFLKIGLFTFGGGYAMISVIENICVEKKKWITSEEMLQVAVIAESTPGPIAINCATFVGYRHGGVLGAFVATFGVVLPSFVIIFGISMFLDRFLEITVIANAFRGIQIAVGILIVNAAVKMWKKLEMNKWQTAMLLGAFTAMLCINFFSWNVSTISLLLIAGVLGLVGFGIQKARAA